MAASINQATLRGQMPARRRYISTPSGVCTVLKESRRVVLLIFGSCYPGLISWADFRDSTDFSRVISLHSLKHMHRKHIRKNSWTHY